jgi:hypothetical protein
MFMPRFQINTSCCQGIDIKEMLVGAALMDEETRNTVVCLQEHGQCIVERYGHLSVMSQTWLLF